MTDILHPKKSGRFLFPSTGRTRPYNAAMCFIKQLEQGMQSYRLHLEGVL